MKKLQQLKETILGSWLSFQDDTSGCTRQLKENDEVDMYKARLIDKGYKQEFGVDYK